MDAKDVVEAFLSDPDVNAQYREHLDGWSADQIAKAITHFAFRNGPVEDMHASPKNQLSQQDMKTLNKFMHNRLTYVVQLVAEHRWTELAMLLECYRYSGTGWDPAEPDDGGLRHLVTMDYDSFRKQNRKPARVGRTRPQSDHVAVGAANDMNNRPE